MVSHPARRRLDPALQPRGESRAVSLRPRGYGLFGVILDVGLRVTDNATYVATVSEMKFSQLAAYFEDQVHSSSDVELVETDVSISPASLLRAAVTVAYQKQAVNTRRTDPLQDQQHTSRDRYFFDLWRQYGWSKRLRLLLAETAGIPCHGCCTHTKQHSALANWSHQILLIQGYRRFAGVLHSAAEFWRICQRLARHCLKSKRSTYLDATVRYIVSPT